MSKSIGLDMRADALLVAIRAKCMDCSGGTRKLVEKCQIKECALYPYRCASILRGLDAQDALRGQMTIFDAMAREQNAESAKSALGG